jgi:hypothetical protein
MIEPPTTLRQYFVDAGWYPGRYVPVPAFVPRDHPAWAILAAFGELKFFERERDPDSEPMVQLAIGAMYHSSPKTWSNLLGSELVGIADLDNAHGELFLAADGRCFGLSSVHDAFWFEGISFEVAVEEILLGRSNVGQPMLRPDQRYVDWCGKRFTAGSPELYRYG